MDTLVQPVPIPLYLSLTDTMYCIYSMWTLLCSQFPFLSTFLLPILCIVYIACGHSCAASSHSSLPFSFWYYVLYIQHVDTLVQPVPIPLYLSLTDTMYCIYSMWILLCNQFPFLSIFSLLILCIVYTACGYSCATSSHSSLSFPYWYYVLYIQYVDTLVQPVPIPLYLQIYQPLE